VGEFGLIERLAAVLSRGSHGGPLGLLAGIGDDAAVWQQERAALVATTDMLVEGVHFDLSLTTWYDLGWKALAVNLSDVAAMGAAPSYAFVSLALRRDVTVWEVEALYEGMRTLAEQAGCAVAGGDTVAVPRDQVINVAVLGHVPYDEAATLLRRDRGRPGDVVAVTGVLGASAAGLYALQHPDPFRKLEQEILVDDHLRPQPQLEAGQLIRQAGVRCAMDVSDGLLADLGKLCQASGVGARVRAHELPLSPVAVELYPERALGWAAGGGEDYQLLFCAPPDVMAAAAQAVQATGLRITAIGQLEAPPGVRLVNESGREVPVASRGWDHFGSHEG